MHPMFRHSTFILEVLYIFGVLCTLEVLCILEVLYILGVLYILECFAFLGCSAFLRCFANERLAMQRYDDCLPVISDDMALYVKAVKPQAPCLPGSTWLLASYSPWIPQDPSDY